MAPQESLKVYRAGRKAYYDTTFSGLVPVRVRKVLEPGRGDVISSGNISVEITADRGPYKKGEVLLLGAHSVVPCPHIKRRMYGVTINVLYAWEKDE